MTQFADYLSRPMKVDWIDIGSNMSVSIGIVMNMNLGCGKSVRERSIKTSQVALRTNLPGCPRPAFYEPRRRRFSTQGRHSASENFTRYKFVFFSALSAPRAFAKPNSVFKNISASIVLVRQRTFYCWSYNVLKVSQFCRAAALFYLLRYGVSSE